MEHQLSSSFDHNRRTKVSYLINSLLIMQCSLLKGPVRVKWNVIGVFWCRCSWAISIGRDPTCNRSRGQKRALYELFNIRGHTTQSILPGFASENQGTLYPVLFPLGDAPTRRRLRATSVTKHPVCKSCVLCKEICVWCKNNIIHIHVIGNLYIKHSVHDSFHESWQDT